VFCFSQLFGTSYTSHLYNTMVEACTNVDRHSHSCFLLPRPKCSSLELLFSPSPPDSKEKSTHVSWARSLVDRPFMLLAHFTGSYIICVFLLVSPFFSLFNSFSEEMDLWGSFGDCTHFVDRILRISHTKQFQSCQRQLSLLGFIQFVTIDDLLFSFPFGSLVLRYFEDSLWISYIIPLPFLPHE
jgi:hypothetical protein